MSEATSAGALAVEHVGTGFPGLDPTATDQPSTRPAVASRKARRPKAPRKVTRYTLDLEQEQHRFMRLFAIQNDVEASKVMRTLLYLLEANVTLEPGQTLADRVLDELFADDDAEDDSDV